MRILQYNEAVNTIAAPSEYLSALNAANLKARGVADMHSLIIQRKQSVIDLYNTNYNYYRNILHRLCDRYHMYAKYIRYTGIIMTDGTDECGASHCYGNNIVLSILMFTTIDHLMPHEIWHIISRQLEPAKLHSIYSIFGIYPAQFTIPQHIRDILLVNPDNMSTHYAFLINNRMFAVMSVIANDRLFGTTCIAEIINGVLTIITGDLAAYISTHLAEICDTTYITGADEVIADNFANYYTRRITERNSLVLRMIHDMPQ
jgi:hypothetical protein